MTKILFVEDDKIIASGLYYSLTQEGYCVTHCLDVESAKEAIQAGPFALTILDLYLPDGSGYNICRILKAKGDIPLIFLTANDDKVKVVMGLGIGADLFDSPSTCEQDRAIAEGRLFEGHL